MLEASLGRRKIVAKFSCIDYNKLQVSESASLEPAALK